MQGNHDGAESILSIDFVSTSALHSENSILSIVYAINRSLTSLLASENVVNNGNANSRLK
jgi:hypothetical protein